MQIADADCRCKLPMQMQIADADADVDVDASGLCRCPRVQYKTGADADVDADVGADAECRCRCRCGCGCGCGCQCRHRFRCVQGTLTQLVCHQNIRAGPTSVPGERFKRVPPARRGARRQGPAATPARGKEWRACVETGSWRADLGLRHWLLEEDLNVAHLFKSYEILSVCGAGLLITDFLGP